MMTAKRGSALLIVLGFLSFMVVSAVAFSIYMRSERLPSSALRRAVANRHLVKAALARAIGDIDDAVRHEPFPGCLGQNGPQMAGSAYGKSWPGGKRRAEWYGRVFMPICWEGPAGKEDQISQVDERDLYLVPNSRQGETVSTMTLEGLGYVPPPLANEARLLGPKSWAAKWHYFDYDAGRYAYTALNVSDYFDLNRIHAATNRNSGADGRISLAYLFANASGSLKTSSVENFEKFVHQNRNGQTKYAFVSMLDYSLALAGNSNSYGLVNPFYDYLKSGGRTLFYGNSWGDGAASVATDEEYLKIARQVFVTDSWCPFTNIVDKANTVDLTDREWLPFQNIKDNQATFDDATVENKFWNKFLRQFPIPTSAALYDYLDPDDVPMSLILPCVEQAPMVAKIFVDGTPPMCKIRKNVSTTGNAPNRTRTTTYTLGVDLSGLRVNATTVFPFKRVKDPDSYTIQAAARVFFAPFKDPASRVMRGGLGRFENKSEWGMNGSLGDNNSSIVVVSSSQSCSPRSNIKTEDDAIKEVVGLSFSTPNDAQTLLLMTVVEQEVNGVWGSPATDLNGTFRFLDDNFAQNIADSVVPQIALTVRIKNSSDDTVDLAPALAADDEILNNRSGHRNFNAIQNVCGSANPFLLFSAQVGGNPLAQTQQALDVIVGANVGIDVPCPFGDFDYKCCYCLDPRYNWAPEDWVFSASERDWLDVCGDFFGGAGAGEAWDHDIFMSVSNLGYLQSVGEFMFIPRVKDCYKDGSTPSGGDPEWGLLYNSGLNGVMRTAVNELANYRVMWRTLKPRQLGGDDELYELDIINGTGGYKVNPYTDNEQIFLAAIANTPVNWWAAGTNTDSRTSSKDKSDLKFSNAIKDTFGPESDSDKWTWDQVRSIAGTLQAQMRANSSSADGWLRAYDDLWRNRFNSDKENELFGQQISGGELCDADRKFLYDFWRGCFGCCQQLFLIFVRAESTALGGSGDGRTPGQLGARAVALVWRDPNEPLNSQDRDYNQPKALSEGDTDSSPRPPHKTRVLFYHQFD